MIRPPPPPQRLEAVLPWACEMYRYVLAIRPIPGRGLLGAEKTDGIELAAETYPAKPGGAVATPCPLGTVTLSGSDYILTGGYVSGGYSSIYIPDTNLGNAAAVSGKHVWVEAEFTATVADDVLAPGGTLDAATVSSGASVPDGSAPAWDSPAGTIHIPLGVFSSSAEPVWTPAGCGAITVSHCAGVLTATRG